jgi:hypothetical protein
MLAPTIRRSITYVRKTTQTELSFVSELLAYPGQMDFSEYMTRRLPPIWHTVTVRGMRHGQFIFVALGE